MERKTQWRQKSKTRLLNKMQREGKWLEKNVIIVLETKLGFFIRDSRFSISDNDVKLPLSFAVAMSKTSRILNQLACFCLGGGVLIAC